MRLTMRKGWQGELGGRAKWAAGGARKCLNQDLRDYWMRRMGKLLITLTQRVGHYPDNRSILTFLILTTRVERVPRPGRIALRDTP